MHPCPEHDIEYVINVGSSLETTEKSIALAEQYDFIYAAVGVHPSDVTELNEENFKAIEQAQEHKKGGGSRGDRTGLLLG